jgi:hypothetical protein
VVFLLAFVAVLVPWYLRNSSVAEADTGLSSGAGINFYFAHNDSGIYGWYPEDEPFAGLSDAEASDLAWRLAFDYLRPNPLRVFANTPLGTYHLLANPDYAIYWSTYYVPDGGDRNDAELFVQREIVGLRTLEVALFVTAMALIVVACVSVVAVRRWTKEIWTMVLPLIGTTWFLRTVVYWAKPRYRYFADVMLVFLAALVIWILARGDPAIRGGE